MARVAHQILPIWIVNIFAASTVNTANVSRVALTIYGASKAIAL